MAYTVANWVPETQADADFYIHGLGADFNQSNYIRVLWSSQPIAVQGQSTPPTGILCSINAPAQGTERSVNGGTSHPGLQDGMIYGTTQAANGLYYKAGQDAISPQRHVELSTVSSGPSHPGMLDVSFILNGFGFPVKQGYYEYIGLYDHNGEGVCGAEVPWEEVIDVENPNMTKSTGIGTAYSIPESDIGKTYSFKAKVPNVEEPFLFAEVVIPAPTE